VGTALVARALRAALGALLVLVVATGAAAADGGKLEVVDAALGGYRVTVMASPNPMRVGTVDVSVLLETAGNHQVEQGAAVTVLARPSGSRRPFAAFPATHANATNPLYYAANVTVATPGRWDFRVRVQGPAGEGDVAFSDTVSSAVLGLTPWQLVVEGLPFLGLLAVIAWGVADSVRGWRGRRRGGRS
jgi:hypothetical protein